MNILKPPAKSALESEMEQTVAKYAAVEAAAKKVADVSGKSSLEMALGSGSALRIQVALEQSLHTEPQISEMEQTLAKYATVEAAANKIADMSGKSSFEMALGSDSALGIQAALEKSLQMEAQLKRFGSRSNPLSEYTMRHLEEQIPELAVVALKQAYIKALASGIPVVEAIDGKLVETTIDRQRRIIGTLPAPYKVEPGTKRIRRIEK